MALFVIFFFFFQAEDGIRVKLVTGVQTCALPIFTEPILLFGAAILGLCFGSFLNVCILRLAKEDKKDRSLFRPPSSCPRCHRPIAWRDNIPVVSWLLLHGRCRWCGQPISKQYPIVEGIVGVLWLGAVLAYGPTLHFVAAGGPRPPPLGGAGPGA